MEDVYDTVQALRCCVAGTCEECPRRIHLVNSYYDSHLLCADMLMSATADLIEDMEKYMVNKRIDESVSKNWDETYRASKRYDYPMDNGG